MVELLEEMEKGLDSTFADVIAAAEVGEVLVCDEDDRELKKENFDVVVAVGDFVHVDIFSVQHAR